MSKHQLASPSEMAFQNAMFNDLLDENQAANHIQVQPGTLAVWRSTGRYSLPFIKIGRKVRYRLSDLNSWLESRTQTNGSTA